MNKILINNKWLKLIRIVLILSSPFFTYIVSNRFNYNINAILLGCLFSLIAAMILFNSIKLDSSISKKKLIIYVFIASYILYNLLPYANISMLIIQESLYKLNNYTIPLYIIASSIGLLALPITIFYVKFFFDYILDIIISFFKNLSYFEKKYLYFTLIVASIIVLTVVNSTIVFSRPNYDDAILYTSDTGALLRGDVFVDISHRENDIRQPLFGIFSLPFGITARAISKCCFFFRTQYEYESVLTIMQALLLAVSTILIARLLNIKENSKKYFYLLVSCSFPYILFTLLLEQYVIALFYLILAIYYFYKNPTKTNYFYVAATGTLLTSGIIFPMITKFKSFKEWMNSAMKCFIAFFAAIVMGGQFSQISTFISQFNWLFYSFAQGPLFMGKFYQYTAFVRGLFFPNHGMVFNAYAIPNYQLPLFVSIDWIGVLILIACLVSFILNHKNKMAIVSMIWVIFSSVILLFAGWGTVENGLILYSLYFAWAFFVLIYLLFDKLCSNKRIFKTILICFIVLMMYTNVLELLNIFRFAVQYYK